MYSFVCTDWCGRGNVFLEHEERKFGEIKRAAIDGLFWRLRQQWMSWWPRILRICVLSNILSRIQLNLSGTVPGCGEWKFPTLDTPHLLRSSLLINCSLADI